MLAWAALGQFAACNIAQADEAADPADGRFAIHGQATFVLQGTPGFPANYDGPNSLTPHQLRMAEMFPMPVISNVEAAHECTAAFRICLGGYERRDMGAFSPYCFSTQDGRFGPAGYI